MGLTEYPTVHHVGDTLGFIDAAVSLLGDTGEGDFFALVKVPAGQRLVDRGGFPVLMRPCDGCNKNSHPSCGGDGWIEVGP